MGLIKNVNIQRIDFCNLMGGECLVGTPESMPDICLQQAYNFEYGGETLQPQTVPGVTLKLDLAEETTKGFYDSVHDIYLVASGQNLYSITVDFITKTLLGTLTGVYSPVFVLYDTFCLVASGGQIQKYDGSALSILDNSPLSHWVGIKFGRVVAYNILSDVYNYSAIGDPTGWTNTPSDLSSSQFIYIGYKDAGTITATISLSSDTIVLKSSGTAYRIIGENNFSTVSVSVLANRVYAWNHYSGLSVKNKAYFVGKEGFESFGVTDAYGAMTADDPAPGYYINPWLAINSDSNAIVWHIPSKKQIWVKGQNDKLVWIYHYNVKTNGIAGSWTHRDFQYQIHDVMIKNNEVYVLYGNKIGLLDETTSLDDENTFPSQIITKRFLPNLKKYIINHFNYVSYNILTGDAVLSIYTKQYPYIFSSTDSDIFGDDSDIYGDDTPIVSDQNSIIQKNLQKRAKYLEAQLVVNSGRVSIQGLNVSVSEVNF